MTSYEQGFLTKCAEYGVPENLAVRLLKSANDGEKQDAPNQKWSVPDNAPSGVFRGAVNYAKGNLQKVPSMLIGSDNLWRDAKHTAAVGKRQFKEGVKSIRDDSPLAMASRWLGEKSVKYF